MNTDSGLFHLLMAVKSTRNHASLAQTQESPSVMEPKLPDIDHSLLIRTIPPPDRPPVRANGCCEFAAADLARETTKRRISVGGPERPAIVRRFLENAGWIVPGTILALLPKCPACVATYAVIGAGVGFSLSGMTYLRALLAILCTVSLLYLTARGMRPFIATIFATQRNKSCEQDEGPWTNSWVRNGNRFADHRLQRATSEYDESPAPEEAMDMRDRILLLTAALATQLALGATSSTLYSRDGQAVDRTANLFQKPI
jgi:hypothetical protein